MSNPIPAHLEAGELSLINDEVAGSGTRREGEAPKAIPGLEQNEAGVVQESVFGCDMGQEERPEELTIRAVIPDAGEETLAQKPPPPSSALCPELPSVSIDNPNSNRGTTPTLAQSRSTSPLPSSDESRILQNTSVSGGVRFLMWTPEAEQMPWPERTQPSTSSVWVDEFKSTPYRWKTSPFDREAMARFEREDERAEKKMFLAQFRDVRKRMREEQTIVSQDPFYAALPEADGETLSQDEDGRVAKKSRLNT